MFIIEINKDDYMVLRFKHIKSRFLTQIALTLGYAILILLLAYIVISKAAELNKNMLFGARIEGKAHQLALYHNSFINDMLSEKASSYSADHSMIKFEQISRSLVDTLSKMQGDLLKSKQIELKDNFDSLRNQFNSYVVSSKNLALNFQNYGNASTGLIHELVMICDKIIEASANTSNTSTLLQFIEAKHNFICSGEPAEINNLTIAANSLLLSYPSFDENPYEYWDTDTPTQTSPDNSADLLRSLDGITEQLQNAHALIGMGNTETGGLSENRKSFTQLMDLIFLAENNFHHANMRTKYTWIGIAILIIILLTFAYIFSLSKFSRLVDKPIQDLLNSLDTMSKGNFNSGTELDPKENYEFGDINQRVNQINTAFLERKKFVDSLLKQKFNLEIQLQGKKDTFGKTLLALKENMRKAREEQLKHTQENEIRRYINEGLAKFADVLRSHSNDTEKLSDHFIRELVKYMGALQGGLFLVDEKDDQLLNLAAAFAYDRKKYMTRTIKFGEGLIGTCAMERKTINLTELPPDYVMITSGLGDAPPNNILILPVMQENDLVGIIELASLKEYNEHEVELGEHIANNLASTLITVRNNSRTANLLAKSQQQAAEMSEQEEEMRQNMEELKATQEESARREEELEGMMHAIDKAFIMVEYDMDGTAVKANQKLLEEMNLVMEDVLGMTHQEIFSKKSDVDLDLIQSVLDGLPQEVVEQVNVGKETKTIKHTFSPIVSGTGLAIRVLNLARVVEN